MKLEKFLNRCRLVLFFTWLAFLIFFVLGMYNPSPWFVGAMMFFLSVEHLMNYWEGKINERKN